jgi:4-hydroxybutyrate dehydrogenase
MTGARGLVLWSFPTRVVLGEGAATQCAKEAHQLGATRVLLVSDHGIEQAGLLDPIRSALDAVGLPHVSALDISSNPLEAEVLGAARVFDEFKADLVLGVGGGSVLDVAKLVRLAVTHPAPLAQYDDTIGGGDKIAGPLPHMIAIPTTAGTGSEVGRSGVVTIQATNRKTVIFSPLLLPEVAILDPAMTQTMPPAMTAATGMDALTHCIEAYASVGDHPMADAIALGGVRLCHRSLQAATDDGKDLNARGDMLKAAMMGAVAFQKGLGACHSLAHPLSNVAALHHGLACALCLPAVVRFNLAGGGLDQRFAEVTRLLTGTADGDRCDSAVTDLRARLGLAGGLVEAGVDLALLDQLADEAIEDGCHGSNPRPCTRDDMLGLYRDSA